MTIRLAVTQLLVLVGLLVGGCGGTTSDLAHVSARGVATLTVHWPARTRVIPTSSNSLHIKLSLKGHAITDRVIPRPQSGQTQTTTMFSELPIATLDVSVDAYPTTDGTGIAQAAGSGTLVVSTSQTNSVTVSLASTVATLALNPTPVAIESGKSQKVSLSAQDVSGNVILLAVGSATEPITWTSSAPSIATVSSAGPTAMIRGLTSGSATISASMKVKDDGTTIVSTVPVLVTPLGFGTYTVNDLGTLGGLDCIPSALSSNGAVSGTSTVVSGSSTVDHGFFWSSGHMTDLGLFGFPNPQNAMQSTGVAVNASGTVIGSVYDSLQRGYRAYLYSSGVSTQMQTALPRPLSIRPVMIHDDGDYVGYIECDNGFGAGITHPMLWHNGKERDLVAELTRWGSAACINAKGKVVANVQFSDGSNICDLWQDGVAPIPIGPTQFQGAWLNDSDVVVGGYPDASRVLHASKWSAGASTDLGTLGLASFATCINNGGVIVGYSQVPTGEQHAFLYKAGVLKDLNSVVSIPGWTLQSAVSINDAGQILCLGTNGSHAHSFLLTPK